MYVSHVQVLVSIVERGVVGKKTGENGYVRRVSCEKRAGRCGSVQQAHNPPVCSGLRSPTQVGVESIDGGCERKEEASEGCGSALSTAVNRVSCERPRVSSAKVLSGATTHFPECRALARVLFGSNEVRSRTVVGGRQCTELTSSDWRPVSWTHLW